MNGKRQAIERIADFLCNETSSCLLLTGTHQYNKHILVMSTIEKHYRNAHVLFRVNSMQNIPDAPFLGCIGVTRQPRAGESVRIGKNVYEFDSSTNRGTWNKSSNAFDFVIIYPIDWMLQESNTTPIENCIGAKRAKKIILCSWADTSDDFSMIDRFYQEHVIFDAEEEDPEYHKRVLETRRL